MKMLETPLQRFVNYSWLNVRNKPSLSSDIIKRLPQNEEVSVLGYPTSSWAYVQSADGQKGYVSRRYLSMKPQSRLNIAQNPDADAPSVSFGDTEPIEEAVEATPEERVVEVADTPESNDLPETNTISQGMYDVPEIFEVPIITYHHISDNVDQYPANLVLPEINFLAQLDWLVENGFQTLTFYQLRDIRDGKMRMPEKAVILTFDDGYADQYLVSQHLNGKGLKGVFNITTDNIGTEGFLDWRQVKKMRGWGMEIASKGVSGANLAATGDFYVQDELERSKQIIEEQLGESIISFAYPEGAYNADVIEAAKAAGYEFARSTASGSRYKAEQFYSLPNLRVFNPAGRRQFEVWLGN